MSAIRRARKAIIGDMTRTRHMLAVAAVIMGATFIPLVGGPPRAYEIAELREALNRGGEARVEATQQTSEPARERPEPRRSARLEPAPVPAERPDASMESAAAEPAPLLSERDVIELPELEEFEPVPVETEELPAA